MVKPGLEVDFFRSRPGFSKFRKGPFPGFPFLELPCSSTLEVT